MPDGKSSCLRFQLPSMAQIVMLMPFAPARPQTSAAPMPLGMAYRSHELRRGHGDGALVAQFHDHAVGKVGRFKLRADEAFLGPLSWLTNGL